MTVVRTPAADTFGLRQKVLRPHQQLGDMALTGDDDPDTGNFCALDETGRVVGTASVRRERPPWQPAALDAWRLRGMATDPDVRGRGIGMMVLNAVIDHVRALGGGLLWCHARVPSVGFYQRAGFVSRGVPWEEDQIGPHLVMWKRVRS